MCVAPRSVGWGSAAASLPNWKCTRRLARSTPSGWRPTGHQGRRSACTGRPAIARWPRSTASHTPTTGLRRHLTTALTGTGSRGKLTLALFELAEDVAVAAAHVVRHPPDVDHPAAAEHPNVNGRGSQAAGFASPLAPVTEDIEPAAACDMTEDGRREAGGSAGRGRLLPRRGRRAGLPWIRASFPPTRACNTASTRSENSSSVKRPARRCSHSKMAAAADVRPLPAGGASRPHRAHVQQRGRGLRAGAGVPPAALAGPARRASLPWRHDRGHFPVLFTENRPRSWPWRPPAVIMLAGSAP